MYVRFLGPYMYMYIAVLLLKLYMHCHCVHLMKIECFQREKYIFSSICTYIGPLLWVIVTLNVPKCRNLVTLDLIEGLRCKYLKK
jgi:hypothetical protein